MIIEEFVRNYLNRVLSTKAYTEKPKNPPKQMVLIEKTGSSGGHIKSSTLAVQSYAESMYKAASLNEEVKEAMEGLYDLDEICHIELNSDYNFTDTATKDYRYQAVFDITHY